MIMMLIYLVICLIITMSTLEYYVVSGFHARTHRLLPLVLGLLALYEFYLIVETLTGANVAFDILKQLLLVQVIDVILYYILDLTNVKMTILQNCLLFVLLIGMDLLIFHQVSRPGAFRMHILLFIVISVVGILTLVVKNAPKREMISSQMRRNNLILITAIFVPAISLLLSAFEIAASEILLPLAINITCIILDYLFLTDRLREVDSVLKEEHFQTLKIPAFLFDTDFFFLDASKKAREAFPEQIHAIELSPSRFELQEQLRQMLESSGVIYRVINNVFYRCELQEAEYNGKKKGYILTFMDITEQKREADLAKETARLKSDFLASMSHDLRSPLHAIIGSSEIVLSRGGMTSKNITMVNHIHDAGNNLLDIVNSILDFSKLESGNFKLHPQKYSLKKLIEEQASFAFANLKDKEVLFSIEITDPYPEFLYGDELRVRQIVQNLISNAIKFTEIGKIECRLSVQIKDKDCVYIEYSVRDTGCGMDDKQLETVFSDYVTYANEIKKEGTGLGLSIVKKLSEMMGGGAKAYSDGKTGSTFTIFFNQQLIEEDVEQMVKEGITLMEPLSIKNASEIDSGSVWQNDILPNFIYPKANILMADDMSVNCEIFKELISPWEVNVDIAINGLEAVDMAEKKEYDLIFLDQMMPVMTGLEASDELLKKGIEVPKILLSANITESLKEQSRVHGFDAFMHKPIDIETLRNNVEQFLPEDLREEYDKSDNMISQLGTTREVWYEKALEIFVEEMSELYLLLPQYKDNDKSMFRNKVHGIKGVSRQLGRNTLSSLAEVMEMAVVSEHFDFINNHFALFYGELDYVIQTSRQELAALKRKENALQSDEDEDNIRIQSESVHELFVNLKTAFEDYEMTDIENILGQLYSARLSKEETLTVEKVKALYDDMEYEDALEILSSFLE